MRDKKFESIYEPSLKINSMYENDISQIRYLISLIESYDLKESFDVLYNYMGNLLNRVPVVLLTYNTGDSSFNPRDPGNFIGCFRTRKIKSLSEIEFEEALWARPKEDVDYYGRCHSPNQEVLYCSSSLGVTLYELDLKKNDLITVIRYASKDPNERIALTALGDERYKFEDDDIINENKIESLYAGLSKKNREKLHTIEKFIIRSFRRKIGLGELERYKITSAIVKFFFNEPTELIRPKREEGKISGVLYPSVKVGVSEYNFAFNNRMAKEHFRVADVFAGRVTEFNSSSYSLSIEHKIIGTDGQGKFIWGAIS